MNIYELSSCLPPHLTVICQVLLDICSVSEKETTDSISQRLDMEVATGTEAPSWMKYVYACELLCRYDSI